MATPTLSLACWDYDRTAAVIDGSVPIEGWRIEPTVLTPTQIFARAFTEAPFDVSELSLSSYMMQVAQGTCAYVAVPAFVSRAFRHGGVYVRTDRDIAEPKDLEGKLVGVPEYQMTMALWVRGILADEHDVDCAAIRWRTGGTNKPGRKERLPLDLPAAIDVAPIAADQTLNGLLAAGELDAVVAPAPPQAFVDGDKAIRRLFPNPVAAEKAYYEKTGLFPIMHVIGVRRTLADAHPELPARVYAAFAEARRLAMERLRITATESANRISLPWVANEWEATRRLMGDDFWPYGVERNRNDLETACRYSAEQHLAPRRLGIEDLFHPDTLAT